MDSNKTPQEKANEILTKVTVGDIVRNYPFDKFKKKPTEDKDVQTEIEKTREEIKEAQTQEQS